MTSTPAPLSGTAPAAAPRRPSPLARLKDDAYGAAKNGVGKVNNWLKFSDRYRHINRASGRTTLVTMLIGYKPALWEPVVRGLLQALPADCDVCLISPGKFEPGVEAIAERHGWSYLSTSTNDVSLAQNIGIQLHPQAELIVKVDEDMFLLPDTLTGTIEFFRATQRAGVIDPGFASPMIPINGVCYRPLLQLLGKLDEYESLFGTAKLSTSGIPVQTSPEAARWIWQATAPIGETVQKLRAAALEPILAPIQFSIGAIVFERKFWNEFGFFPVYRHKLMMGHNTLGCDERHICKATIEWFKPGIVCPTTLAGHFSFGPQYEAVKQLMDEQPALFAV